MTESKFGTSGPITEEGPTPYGEFQYAKLLEYLHVTKKVFESADANKKRMAVFEKLNKIVREWASSVGKLKNVPEDVYSEVTKLHPLAAARTVKNPFALDLPAALHAVLTSESVAVVSDFSCTYEDSELFSYRRDGTTGRQAGIISL